MIRVLVAEDSATARQVIVDAIGADPGMEVVGIATDGAEAVAAAIALRPSIVTMDIEMPILGGYEATRLIMRDAPVPILIVSGVANPTESVASLNALRAGALGIVAKPSGGPDPEGVTGRRRLIGQIRALADVKVVRRMGLPVYPSASPTVPAQTKGPIAVVGIAASSGGPAALAQIVAALRADLPVPLVVVQHNAHGFMPALAKWLNDSGNLRVIVASDGEELQPGMLYVAPDDRHLGVTAKGFCSLHDGPAIGGFRPSATFLFESIARSFGARSLSVILTGMGNDGVDGLAAVHRAGGQVIAQNERSSVVWGMPGAAVAAGVVDSVIDLGAVAAAITVAAAGWR